MTIRLIALATVGLSLILAAGDASRPSPPATPEHDVVENYHGKQVHDQYRWLEQTGVPAVEQWINAQSAYTDAVMSAFPGHDAIIERVGHTSTVFTLDAYAHVLPHMQDELLGNNFRRHSGC